MVCSHFNAPIFIQGDILSNLGHQSNLLPVLFTLQNMFKDFAEMFRGPSQLTLAFP